MHPVHQSYLSKSTLLPFQTAVVLRLLRAACLVLQDFSVQYSVL